MDTSSYFVAQSEDDDHDESDDEVDCCDACQGSDTEFYFCKACGVTFCSHRWKMQRAHKKKGSSDISKSGAILHEKTKLSTKKLMDPVFPNRADNSSIKARLAEDSDAAWFGISREEGDNTPVIFHDYGRFAELMASMASPSSTPERLSIAESVSSTLVPRRTPSLVSFVGEAGAGKSTLIKLLILLKAPSGLTDPQCPVGGSSGSEDPTSEDVHLYIDPLSSLSDAPILYADCEGLNGGEREPLATISRRELNILGSEDQSLDEEASFFRTRYSSQRELQWAKEGTKNSGIERTRNFAVSRFYPRLLFTFSDVVIFVHRNPKVIEGVLEQLIEWADAALETACNQPILPHAIILLNASPNNIDPNLWDVDFATKKVLESLAATVNQNATFSRYARLWKERDRVIKNVEDLMMCYYSSVKVIRIPTDMQPNLVVEQAQKLYDEIELGCQKARKRKSDLRMLLDAKELQSYLQDAFDLYSKSLDIPFDFVQASFLHNPIPFNFGGNILKLAIEMMKEYRVPDARAIFNRLGNLVASCIMLDAVRHNVLGTADLLFPRYLDYLDKALKSFCDQHWPCEYVMHGTTPYDLQYDLGHRQSWNNINSATVTYRCVNVSAGHESKGHQNKDGRIFAKGDYFSNFSFQKNHEEFQARVYYRLEHLLYQLTEFVHNGEPQETAAARMHQDNLRDFFYRPSHKNTGIDLQNRAVCWCCLFEGPVHALHCGHVLCTACVKAYGRLEGRTVVGIHECPFELHEPFQSQSIYIKPPTAGLRMLVLDDGGVRGIIQLEILRLIDKELNGRIPLRLLFDLIVGSGSGSIIALGLLTSPGTIDDCRAKFLRVFREAFASRNLRKFPRLKHSTCKYRPKILEQSLREAFTENHVLLGTGTDENVGCLTKLAIPVLSSKHMPMIFTNYVRRSDLKLPCQIYSPANANEEIKIWEASRAAMANPFLFKPFKHKASSQVFSNDTNLVNPIMTAGTEINNLWGSSSPQALLDIVVSFGSGVSIGQPSIPARLEKPTRFSKAARHFKRKKFAPFDQQCEQSWNEYLHSLPSGSMSKNRQIRLNIRAVELPAVDDVSSFEDLQNMVQTQINPRTIQTLTAQLIGKFFYFEKLGEIEMTPRRDMFLRGEILCRIPDRTPEISRIGELLKAGRFRSNSFVIQEQLCERQYLSIPSSVTEDMIRHRIFHMPEVKINISERRAEFNVLLHLENNEEYSISGFPRPLVGKEAQSERQTRDGSESSTSIRRRPQWTPPSSYRHSHVDSGLQLSDRAPSIRIPSSSTANSIARDDIPAPRAPLPQQAQELDANDPRDREELQKAMIIEHERSRIRSEEVAPLELRLKDIEASQRKLTAIIAELRSPSSSEFSPQWPPGMVSPDLDDAPLLSFNSANPSRENTVRRQNQRPEGSSNYRDLLGGHIRQA